MTNLVRKRHDGPYARKFSSHAPDMLLEVACIRSRRAPFS